MSEVTRVILSFSREETTSSREHYRAQIHFSWELSALEAQSTGLSETTWSVRAMITINDVKQLGLCYRQNDSYFVM